jgi:hypothetical protein
MVNIVIKTYPLLKNKLKKNSKKTHNTIFFIFKLFDVRKEFRAWKATFWEFWEKMRFAFKSLRPKCITQYCYISVHSFVFLDDSSGVESVLLIKYIIVISPYRHFTAHFVECRVSWVHSASRGGRTTVCAHRQRRGRLNVEGI